MRRGEIWWADLAPPIGRRPVVLLSRDAAYAVRTFLTVAPVTTRIRGIRVEVPLGREDGVPQPSVVNLDSITTIPRTKLRERLGVLTATQLDAVEQAIRFGLGMER